jgi:hypothetical protein
MEPAIASQEPVEHDPRPNHTNDECGLCFAFEKARRILEEEN